MSHEKTSRQGEKPTAMQRAEAKGQQLLHEYCRAKVGIQADLVRATGIYPATMSQMHNGKMSISPESAMLIEVATNGQLRAAALCPSRADLFAQFKALG